MQYLGGKYRIAKQVTQSMVADGASGNIWEPFMGGANVTPYLVEAFDQVTASDWDAAAIALIQAVSSGWRPPEIVTQADYATARTLPEADPLHGFAAFGCSFGGKRWGGYARGAAHRNYAAGSARALLRAAPALARARILRGSYDELDVAADVIYCDPPYANTTGYGAPFDHGRFWAWCRTRAQVSRVYVSEYTCPVSSMVVATIARRLELQGTHRERVEHVFRVLPR